MSLGTSACARAKTALTSAPEGDSTPVTWNAILGGQP